MSETSPTGLSTSVTHAVLAVPSVRRVIPVGPDLAGLVRDPGSVLAFPRDGSALRIETTADGVRIRVVVGVDRGTPAATSARAVRDAVRAAARRERVEPTSIVVRVVEIG